MTDRDKRPTPLLPPPLGGKRPIPFVPDKHLRDANSRVVLDALKIATEQTPQPRPRARVEAEPLSEMPKSRRAGFRLEIGDLKGFAGVIVALGTAGVIGGTQLKAVTERMDNQATVISDLRKAQQDERTERIAEREQQQAVNLAIACRLRVLASASQRQNYDPGFAEHVGWLSAYLEAKPKGPPMWVAVERCPKLTGGQ